MTRVKYLDKILCQIGIFKPILGGILVFDNFECKIYYFMLIVHH